MRAVRSLIKPLVAALAGAVISVGAAGPAHAVAPPADGIYRLLEGGAGPHTTWAMGALCVQASGTRIQSDYTDPTVQADGCFLNLTSASPRAGNSSDNLRNYGVIVKLADDQWTFVQHQPEGMTCPDGSHGATDEKYAFNDETMSGTHTTIHSAVCGGQPGMTKQPFSLQYIAPLDRPIERYPLYCDGWAHCW